MSTLEKLFVQIFERKNWIVDRVKQQSDLYEQQLASKLLINGIRPPPWLCNSGTETGTADLTELKKQDLICGLLIPPQRSEVPSTSDHCTFYSIPAAKSYNGPTSDSFFMETSASNKYFEAGDRLTVVPKCHLNENELAQNCTLSSACELSPTIASPQGKTSVGASENYFEASQSLARIQRSRPRQKALELRNSAKEKAERPLSSKGNCGVYSGRITRSRSACQQSNMVKELLELNKASDITDDNGGGAAQTKTEKCPSSGNDLKEASVSQVDILPCSDANGIVNQEEWNADIAETNCVLNGSPEACPFLQLNCARGFSQSNYSSKITSGRVRCSKSASTDKHSQLAEPLNWVEVNLQKASEAHVDILPCNDVPRIVNEENGIVGTVHDSSMQSQPCSIDSQSNVHGASHRDGLEFLLKRLPSESGTLLEPKQLVFDDAEVYNLNEGVDPMEKGTQARSLEIRSFSSLGPAESLEKVATSDVFHKKCDTSIDELLVRKELANEIVNREKEAQRGCSEAEAEGRNEFIVEKSICDYYTTSIGKTSKWPAMSSRNATSRICEDAVPDKSPQINKTSNHVLCLTDDLITWQVGEKSPAESQQQKVVDSSFPGVDVDPLGESFGKKCNEELDIGPGKIFPEDSDLGKDTYNSGEKCNEEIDPGKIFPEDCELGKDTSSGPKKATNTDYNCVAGFTLFRKSTMLLRSQEIEVSCVAEKDATRSFLHEMAAADSPQMANAEREPPYYLRSSNSHDKNVGSSKLSGSIIANESITSIKTQKNAVECSWPQSKRRKFEGRSGIAFTASKRLRGKTLQEIHEETEYRYLKCIQNGAEAISEVQHFAPCEMNFAQPNAAESPDVQMHEKESFQKVECLESPTKFQVKEDELALEGRDQSAETTFTYNDKHMESSLDYSLRNKMNGYLQSSFRDKVALEIQPSVAPNLTKESTVEDFQNLVTCESNLNLESTENLSCTDGTMLETHLEDHGSLSHGLVSSPLTKDVDLISADQFMPEFEGFSIGEHTENDLPCIAENGSGFDHSDLLRTSIGQHNILEQLYRSSRMLTPLPHASTKYKVHRTPDIYQSLPNGLLEHMNLRNSLLFNVDESKQVKCSYNGMSEEVDRTFLGRSYSDCISSSTVRFSWDIRKPPCTPPVGKLCQRITAKAANDSLEKQESINSELTCFRIEEDPSIGEENGDTDEMVDPVKEGFQSRRKNYPTKKEPLANVTNGYLNPSTSVSLADKSVERGSLDSVNAGFNTSQTQMDAKQKLKSSYGTQRYKNKDKENQWSSLGGSGSRKATESLQTRFSKPKLSGKVSEGKGGQSLLEKANKRNNIVSNISSFLPFVKQTQPAGAFTGKRDVKVKALEAAEAARRLEEKRENERKMKKEAVKIERARLEQENMRQLELKQKQKEEERKKKESELAARKRLREEEERKEKERKRKCIGEARRQQREHDERLRVEKEEKEKRRRAADEREHKGNERAGEARKLQKVGKSREGSDCRKKTDTELTARVSACDVTEASDFHQVCQSPKKSDEIEKEICNLYKAHEDVEQSYAISPYQGSDDEEEEEDDMPNQKFIPSWASENCLAQILPTLKKVDPDGIFPPSSFCGISEVLLPRKQQLR